MTTPPKTQTELLQENTELRARLEEAEETLLAIRTGEVDALVMGEEVYTLKGAETPYRLLIESMNEGAATLAPDGTVLYCNTRFAEMISTPAEQVIGLHLWQCVVPAQEPIVRSLVATAYQAGARAELTFSAPHGPELPVQLSLRPILKDSATIGVVAADLTERKRAEVTLQQAHDTLEQRVAERTAELRQSEQLYRAIGESIDYGVWVCEPDGRNTYASPSFLKLVGIAQEQCSNFGWGDVLHPDDAERTIAAWKECVRSGGKWDIEHRFRGVDGQWHHVLARGVPVKDEQGQILRWAGINLDITERKRAEEALRFVGECGWAPSGEDFFQALARYLAESLEADFVCIDRLQEGSQVAQTVAVFYDGKFQDNVTYALKDTPCGGVVGKNICCFPRDVRGLFPKDVVLRELLAEGYAGTTLWSAQGQPIGLIALIWRQPLADTRLAASVLQQVALRAAGELERRQAEAEIRRHAEALRARNEELTRFNEAMVGRELRMIELKREVDALCAQLGQPPRYEAALDEEARTPKP